MSSFLLSRFPVPESVYCSIQRELSGLDDKQRRFVLHVLISNVLNLQKITHRGMAGYLDLSIDLPIQWIEEHFSTHFRQADIASAILTRSGYSTDYGYCRSFLASETPRKLVLDWVPANAEAAAREKIVNRLRREALQGAGARPAGERDLQREARS